jgi:Na+/proline symporter
MDEEFPQYDRNIADVKSNSRSLDYIPDKDKDSWPPGKYERDKSIAASKGQLAWLTILTMMTGGTLLYLYSGIPFWWALLLLPAYPFFCFIVAKSYVSLRNFMNAEPARHEDDNKADILRVAVIWPVACVPGVPLMLCLLIINFLFDPAFRERVEEVVKPHSKKSQQT